MFNDINRLENGSGADVQSLRAVRIRPLICVLMAARGCARETGDAGRASMLPLSHEKKVNAVVPGGHGRRRLIDFFHSENQGGSLGYGMRTRFSVPAARKLRGAAVVFLISCSINADSRYGAQAEPRFHCPGGQIYRVSKHVCAPKESVLGHATAASPDARREVMGPPMPPSPPVPHRRVSGCATRGDGSPYAS